MRFGCLAIALAWFGCGNDGVHHLPDGPGGNGSGVLRDGRGGGDGGGGGGGDGGGSSVPIDAPPAVGCDMAEIAAQCPPTITGSTTNTGEPGPFTMTLAGTSYGYEFTDNGQSGVVYSFDRHFTLSCTTMPDNTRAWSGAFHDACFADNTTGDPRVDNSFATFETKVGRCPPYATYAVTSVDPQNGDNLTCEDLGNDSTLSAAP